MHEKPPRSGGGEDAAEFSVHVAERAGGGTAVAVFGELDLTTAPQLREALEPAIEAEGEVLIDLRACGYVDSRGIAVLATAALRLREKGRVLVIRGARPRVERIFDIAGLAAHDSIVLESTEDAG